MILWRTEFSATLRLPNDASLRALEISGALLAVAVFVERSLAVILDLIFVDRKSDPRVGLITSESLSAEFGEILRVQSRKQRIRIIAGFAISVLISLAGLRTLQNLLSGEPSSWTQKLLLQVVDVLLTAGLLAGGSAGIAATIDFLKNRGLTNSLKHLAEVRAFTNLARSSEEKGKSA
jgi:hypothetical protein